jgi:hypothetical protein
LVGHVKVEVIHPSSSDGFRMTGRGQEESEERFLSAQTDRFAGAMREEKVGSLRSK